MLPIDKDDRAKRYAVILTLCLEDDAASASEKDCSEIPGRASCECK
jgi:hypothetical protein